MRRSVARLLGQLPTRPAVHIRQHTELSVADLAVLVRLGAQPAGPSPLPANDANAPVQAIGVDRCVGTAGWVSVGNHIVKVNELRAGTRVGIRFDETTVSVFDLDSRELISVGPNPLTTAEMLKVRGARPAGPPPQPRTDPIRAPVYDDAATHPSIRRSVG